MQAGCPECDQGLQNEGIALPASIFESIYQEPTGRAVTDIEQLKRMYPNSFDMLGSLKEEYNIKKDPSVPPV